MSNLVDTNSTKMSYSKVAKSAADKPISPTLSSHSATTDDSVATADTPATPRTRAISSDSKKLISDILKNAPSTPTAMPSMLSHIKFEPGSTVNVILKDGLQYKGVCGNTATVTKASPSVTLLNAKRVESSTKSVDVSGGQMVIKLVDIASLADSSSASTLPESAAQVDRTLPASPKSFERDLKKWQPESLVDMSLELESSKMSGGNRSSSWDQFAVNEKLFGVRTDFDEDFYTTKLDKHSADYKRREREAHKIAMDIQKSFSNNSHMVEERGQQTQHDSDLDEEDKYGAVLRRQPGSYVPPALRKKMAEQDMAQVDDNAAQEPTKTLPVTTAPAKECAVESLQKEAAAAPSSSLSDATAVVKPVASAPLSKEGSVPASTTAEENEKKPSFKLNPNAHEFKPKTSTAALASFVPGAPYAMPPSMVPYMPGYPMPNYGYPPTMPMSGLPPHAYYYPPSYPSYTPAANGTPYYGNGPIFRPPSSHQ